MDPLTLAGLISGGIGLAGSLFGNKAPEYKSPTFKDISLERDNPELWNELLKLRAASEQANKILAERGTGTTEQQRFDQNQAIDRQRNQYAQMGIGGAMQSAAENDLVARLRAQQADQNFRERMALMQNAQGLDQAYLGALSGAQGQLMNQAQNEAQMRYNDQLSRNQGRNQFFSGLFNAGLGLAGQGMVQSGLNDRQAQLLDFYRQPAPSPMGQYGGLGFAPGYGLNG